MNIDLEDLALEVCCPYCHALPTFWCTTSGGHLASFLHAARSNPVRSAYGLGYAEGWDERGRR